MHLLQLRNWYELAVMLSLFRFLLFLLTVKYVPRFVVNFSLASFYLCTPTVLGVGIDVLPPDMEFYLAFVSSSFIHLFISA